MPRLWRGSELFDDLDLSDDVPVQFLKVFRGLPSLRVMRATDPLDRVPDGGLGARRLRPKRCAAVRGSAWFGIVRSSMDPERTMKFENQIFLFHGVDPADRSRVASRRTGRSRTTAPPSDTPGASVCARTARSRSTPRRGSSRMRTQSRRLSEEHCDVLSIFDPRGRIRYFGSEVQTVRAHVDPRPAEGAIKPSSRQGSTLTTTAWFRRRYCRSTLVFFNSTGQVASTPEHTSFAIPSTSFLSRSRNVYDPPIHMSIC